MAPAEIQRESREIWSPVRGCPSGGMRPSSGLAWTRRTSSLPPGLPGTSTGPSSPPLRANSAVSSRRPPSCFKAPWQAQQRALSNGLTSCGVVDRCSGSVSGGRDSGDCQGEPKRAGEGLHGSRNRPSRKGTLGALRSIGGSESHFTERARGEQPTSRFSGPAQGRARSLSGRCPADKPGRGGEREGVFGGRTNYI